MTDVNNRGNMFIQESDVVAIKKPKAYLKSEKNALNKHKRNFFSTSATPVADDKEFFNRNFAGMNPQQISRVKHKFLQDSG